MGKMRKRIIAVLCAISLVIPAVNMNPKNVKATVVEGFADVARQAAAEGAVLIKNDNNVLPLEGGEDISIFGRIQINYYKSGTGSGGAVRVSHITNILEGLRNNPKVKVNEELAGIYEEWVVKNPFDDGGGGWAAEPWSQTEMPLTDEIVSNAKEVSDTAVVVIGRTAGEDQDNSVTKGSYLLTDAERDMLTKVTKQFNKVVVVLNVANIIDMNWMNDYNIDSVIYTWQGGMEGGDAVADVLTGDVTPSGKLSDTIARNYSDYPSSNNFGNRTTNNYAEDIYVGYRYFETFDKEAVLYPFGYGLSYTTFETITYATKATKDKINVFVTVENTGKRPGKEVVQVYFGAPQGNLGKPAKELAAFAKTGILQPGETQDIMLSFAIDDMSSYDDGGYTGHDSSYVLEEGDYNIFVGNNVRDSKVEFTYKVAELKVVETLSEQMAPVKEYDRMKAVQKEDGTYELTYEPVAMQTVNVPEKIQANLPAALTQTGNKGYKLKDVYSGSITMDQFVAQLSNNDLASLVRAEGMSPTKVLTPGSASCFGGVTAGLAIYGIPIATTTDGPSGIRMESSAANAKATSIPIGTLLACTWNTALVEKLSVLQGEELILNYSDSILGPGMNIHRDPLNGRNFEYFSEDPLLTGMMGSAQTRGIQKSGATTTLKHFCANNQESNRHHADSVVSERALREIYLKGYEMVVKTSDPRAVMTTYNPVNGTWNANNFDLNTEILRNEWGYEGIVMTDWWARMNQEVGSATSGTNYLAAMVRSQNDLYMVVDNNAADGWNDDILSSLDAGTLTVGELQRCATNICTYLLQSPCFARQENMPLSVTYKPGTPWFSITKDESGDPRLTGITVEGREISTFNPLTLDYKVYTPSDVTVMPQVQALGTDNLSVQVTQATSDSRIAVINVKKGGEETIYKVNFSDEQGLSPVFDNPIYAKLKSIKIDGLEMVEFNEDTYEYGVAVDSLDQVPVVTCTAADGVTAAVDYDAAKKLATIKCISSDQVNYYKVQFGIRPHSDDFTNSTLNSFWSIDAENASNWKIVDGKLVITTEKGDAWQTHNDLKNNFVQPAFGNWEITTKIDTGKIPSQNYEGVGIMVKEDDDNYLYLKFEYSSKKQITLTQESAGINTTIDGLTDAQTAEFGTELYLKMKKIGNVYTSLVSKDGINYIQLGKRAVADYASPKFTLVASNGSTTISGFDASFDSVTVNTDVEADVVTIGDDTKLKVAELEPLSITSAITPYDCTDIDGGKYFGNCNKDEYAVFLADVKKTGVYDITSRIASAESETAQVSFTVLVDDQPVASVVTNGTGGAQSWITPSAQTVKLTQGSHKIKVLFDKAGLNLNWVNLKLKEELNYSLLESLIQSAEAKVITSYPLIRQEDFTKALTEAKKVLNSALTQNELDTAKSGLETAINALGATIPITSIKLNTKSATINPGSKMTLQTTIAPLRNTDTITWSSTNPAVAAVDANGTVSALTEGSVVITARTTSGISASANLMVKAKSASDDTQQVVGMINSVTITVGASSLYAGGNTGNISTLKVTLPQGAVAENITYSSNSTAVEVSQTGVITAKNEGSAIISALVVLSNGEAKNFTTTITVKKAYVKFTATKKIIKKGKSFTFKAKAYGSTTKITWKLTGKNASKIAKISKTTGKVTGKKKGSVTVVATSGSLTKTYKVSIK